MLNTSFMPKQKPSLDPKRRFEYYEIDNSSPELQIL